MDLDQLRHDLEQIETDLAGKPCVEFRVFERDGRRLHVLLTDRLRKKAHKGGVWKSRGMCITLKNAAYGFDPQGARCPGGKDGIFLLDRGHRRANEMMHKIFDRFLDRPNSGAKEIAEALGVSSESLVAVRLVSHHMRLLGVLHRAEAEDRLVLVDYDCG
jgi:hypothetical protein